jgi:hypothetical protein
MDSKKWPTPKQETPILLNNFEEKQPTLEFVDDVSLDETNIDGVDVIKVLAKIDDPRESVENKVRNILANKNWWLNKAWAEKGLPKEQLILNIGQNNIEIFNYGEILTQEMVRELQHVVILYGKITNNDFFERVKYILLDNTQEINPNSGEDQNGFALKNFKAIKLNPAALSDVPHRIEIASNFKGTLIHEIAHFFTSDFVAEWKKKFDWQDINEPRVLNSGIKKYTENRSPDRCLNNYALTDENEGICDSMVAYLMNDPRLDPEKRNFLSERFPTDRTDSEMKTDRKISQDIKMPKLKSAKYLRKTPKTFNIRGNQKH